MTTKFLTCLDSARWLPTFDSFKVNKQPSGLKQNYYKWTCYNNSMSNSNSDSLIQPL